MIQRSRIALFGFLFLSISLFAFGQEFPTEKTENHQQIAGTNIFIIPPDLFEPSNNFRGFQNPLNQTSTIMTVEIPGAYSEVTKGFNSDMLKTRGMTLNTKKAVKVGESEGLLIELDQPAGGRVFSKHILVYGDTQSTTFINGVYPKDSLQLGQKIKESILTTLVDFELKSNPRKILDYTLDESASALKFKAVVGNGMIFNRDLKIPTESADKATLMTDKSVTKVEIEDKKLFCVSRLKKYPDDYSVIPDKEISEIELDGLKGFALFAKNNSKENEEMYQVILFDEKGGYYILVGTYIAGSESAVSDLKQLMHTFSRRK